MLMMSLATVVMMVEPPGEPRTSSGLPGLHCRLGPGGQTSGPATMVGVMLESGRLPGAMALAALWMRPYMLGTPGLAVKSSISLLSRKPSAPAVTPEPNRPFSVYVLATALPSASTTEKWVVWVDSAGMGAAAGGGGRKPAGRVSVAEGLGWRGSMDLRQAAA